MIECKMILKVGALSQVMVAKYFIALMKDIKNICKNSREIKKKKPCVDLSIRALIYLFSIDM